MVYMGGIGKNLRKRAKELGLSDTEIARRIGIPQRRYSNYVNDQREPDFRMLKKICNVLGVSYDYLFSEKD